MPLVTIVTGAALLRFPHSLSVSRISPGTNEVVVVVEQRGEYLAFAECGVGQTLHDRHPVPGTDEVTLQAPVPARVRGAVAVAGISGEI